jgi:hypothetical protein
LLAQQGRVFQTQASRYSDLADTTRDSARSSIDNVAIARRDGRWWIWWAGTGSSLVVVRRLASDRASVDIVAGEGKSATSCEYEEAGSLKDTGKFKDEVADLALRGVGLELEVEDCAEVVGCYCCPFGG